METMTTKQNPTPIIDKSMFSEIWLMSQPDIENLMDAPSFAAVAEIDIDNLEPGRIMSGPSTPERGEGNFLRRQNGKSIIDIRGPISPYPSRFSWCFGGTDLQTVTKDLETALDKSGDIILFMDTPGGVVSGIAGFAEMVYKNRERITAYVENANSAGCWVASAAGRVVIAPTGTAGGLGVVTGVRKDREDTGWVTFTSSMSPLKNANPESEEGRDAYQARVDTLADVFVQSVAKHRGMSGETITEKFGRGASLIGANAVKAGMADEVGTLADIIAKRLGGIKMTEKMTMALLRAEHTELVVGIEADAAKNAREETTIRLEREHNAEKERIVSLACEAIGNQDFKKVAESGIDAEGLKAAQSLIAPQIELKSDGVAAMALETLKDSGADVPPGPGVSGPVDFKQKAAAYKKEHGCSIAEANAAIRELHPEAFEAMKGGKNVA